MAQTPRRTSIKTATGSKRPGRDAVTAKQADDFPSVGMTLRSYRYDSRDRSRRSPGQKVIVKQGRWQRLRQRFSFKRLAIVTAVLALLVGGWVGGKFLYNAHKLFGGNIFSILRSTKLEGEDQGRVNILLAGNSSDDVGHSGASLTDSIMVISIDTKNNKAFMLSIPRDLWIEVSGDGHQKINGAYVTGEANEFEENGYPKGGMGQLEQVVEEITGLKMHYFALVNYNALKQAVDAVGGVDFVVKSEDPRGLYDPNIDWETRGPLVKLTNGKHHLDGREALDLARARGDAYNSYGFAGSDFARTEHQRQLLVALKTKAVSAGTLSNPAKLGSLFDAIGNNVKTDFKLDEVRRLYDLTKEIGGGNIQSLSLNEADGKNLLMSYATSNGQSALAPAAGVDDYSDIRAFIKKRTSSNAVVQESARIVVLNGTDSTGLAGKTKRKLTARDMIVVEIGDAGNLGQATTTIINNAGSNKPATKAALIKLFGNQVTTQNPYAGQYEADFIIVVGRDQIPKTTSESQQ